MIHGIAGSQVAGIPFQVLAYVLAKNRELIGVVMTCCGPPHNVHLGSGRELKQFSGACWCRMLNWKFQVRSAAQTASLPYWPGAGKEGPALLTQGARVMGSRTLITTFATPDASDIIITVYGYREGSCLAGPMLGKTLLRTNMFRPRSPKTNCRLVVSRLIRW